MTNYRIGDFVIVRKPSYAKTEKSVNQCLEVIHLWELGSCGDDVQLSDGLWHAKYALEPSKMCHKSDRYE